MDPHDATQASRFCACCIETRRRFLKRNSAPSRSSQTSCSQHHTTMHSVSLKSALNFRWQLYLRCILIMVLLFRTGTAEASCLTGEPYVGYVPAIQQSQLKRQSTTLSADCAEMCCLKKYCDLAWIDQDKCFHARCLTEADCIPLAGADDSSAVYMYVMIRSTSEYNQAPWDLFGNPRKRESYKQDYPHGGTHADNRNTHDRDSVHGDEPDLDNFHFCKSQDDCGVLEFCFGLHQFGEGICTCRKGYRNSEVLNMCVKKYLEGEPDTPSSVSLSTDSSPTTGPENPPIIPPNTYSDTLPKTPLNERIDAKDYPDEATKSPSLEMQPTKGAENDTETVKGEQDGGEAKGGAEPEMGGSQSGGGIEMPHKKNGGDGSGLQGDQLESTTIMETNSSDVIGSPNPLSDNPTQEGVTQTDRGVDALTEKSVVTEERSKVPTPGLPTPDIPAVIKLTVSAGEDKTLQLPDEDSAILIAYVIPETPPKGQEYTYDWQVLEGPDDSRPGEMVGEHAEKLQLAKLSAGVYMFKVEVRGEGSYGSATVNVTVVPPPRVNTPPKAVINPPSQEVILPNPDTFLDGSDSTDDVKIVSFHWEEIEGPVRETKITGDTQTLKLTDLVPGPYVIRLTVTDSDGVTDSALANVTVKEEIDNPPVAKAGKDVIIKLPINSAVLYGNSSFDDHPGMVYEWSKASGPAADMSGTSSAILRLNNLDEGTYVFKLTVTDSKDRKDSDEATVIVKPENNLPPTADAGPDKELSLPDDSTTLDGAGSEDDLAVTSYLWEKVSGPNDPEIRDADKVVATVSGLVAGHYIFKLTVGDKEDATGSDTVDVVVKKEINFPPTANAGPGITIQLPNNVVELDGSESSDDKAIVSYQWKRDPKSPAAGSAAGNSAHEPIVKLTGLVAGIYHMILNVTDAKGASATDTAVITVVKDPHRLNLVAITFDVAVPKYTQQDKIDMTRSLAVLLSVRDEDISIQQVYQTLNEQLQVIFYATNATSNTAIPGPTVVKILTKKKLSSETDLLNFRVLAVDTMICQKNCSGHGECNPYTKLCICESFWMENYFRRWLGDKESNCDWSILYVIIAVCVIAVAFGGFCWILICCIKRNRRKVKRRRRYNLLSQDLDGTESMEMLPKNGNEPLSETTKNGNGNVLDKLTDKGSFQGKQSSSIMISESDDDTDDETRLFDKKRQGKNGKANGSIMTVQPRKKRPFPLISTRTDKL